MKKGTTPSKKTIPLSVPKAALPGLAAIATFGTHLGALRGILEKQVAELDLAGSADFVAERIGASNSEAEALLQALVGLHSLRRSWDVSAETLFDSITGSLEREASDDWKKKSLDAWRNLKPAIVETLSPDHPLGILEKSVYLTYAHQNTLQGMEIVTDVRPVFDTHGSRILRTMVTHLLMLDYDDGSFPSKRLHLALDSDDIRRLKSLCDRAEIKAACAHSAFSSIGVATEQVGDSKSGD